MTEKEAIEHLKVGYLGDTEELVQAKHIAIKALEKQIPKKPIYKFEYEDGRKFHDCPTCGSYVTHAFEQENVRYCNCCGQKLDWEGGE